MYLYILTALTLLAGCSGSDNTVNKEPLHTESIKGRGADGRKFGFYTIKVPQSWIRRDPLPDDLVLDTTKSICEFIINDPDGLIRIAIHNFPAETIDERIPPQAQVARWIGQIEELDEVNSHTTPIAFAGYSGLLFIGVGKKMVVAAALQLHPEHFRNLPVHNNNSIKDSVNAQMRADITIKAVGPVTSMQKHKDDIIASIQTFALIDEIPHPR